MICSLFLVSFDLTTNKYRITSKRTQNLHRYFLHSKHASRYYADTFCKFFFLPTKSVKE